MKCDIVSARRTVWSGEVSLIIADGAAGELGITPRHAPLLTTLKPGAIRVIDTADEERTFMIGGGILEVMPHLVTILVDRATRAIDFDEAAAKRAMADAQRELDSREGTMEIADAQAKLKETIEHLRALEAWRKRVQHKK